MLGKVCPTCRGRGFVYRGGGGSAKCPDCNPVDTKAYRRASAMNGLAHCWSAFQQGETGDYNLSLAVKSCLAAGYSLEELARVRTIPMRVLRAAAAGQGILTAE